MRLTFIQKKVEKNNQIKQGNLVGSTVNKVTHLFNKAGKICLPELRLPWFNTETGKKEGVYEIVWNNRCAGS